MRVPGEGSLLFWGLGLRVGSLALPWKCASEGSGLGLRVRDPKAYKGLV